MADVIVIITSKKCKLFNNVVPGWVNSACVYLRDLVIPFMITWAGYVSSAEGDLVATMQAQPTYFDTCLKIFAFLLFGYTLANVHRSRPYKHIWCKKPKY